MKNTLGQCQIYTVEKCKEETVPFDFPYGFLEEILKLPFQPRNS